MSRTVAAHERWRAERRALNAGRAGLAARAARHYPARLRVAGTNLLARPEWLPGAPVPQDAVELRWTGEPPPTPVDGLRVGTVARLPASVSGAPFARYSTAIAALEPPRLFENRPTYRLLSAERRPGGGVLRFTRGSYFDIVDICEAVAHEFAAGTPGTPVRTLVGDPLDLTRRPVSIGVTTLTLRRRPDGTATFPLHQRDASRVASGGGLYQAMPVGVFQPPGDIWDPAEFDLWRAQLREYAEEFLGESERRTPDYAHWPFARRIDAARRAGHIRVFWLGLGIDPLTLVADLLTVAVIDAGAYDELFAGLVTGNEEGRVLPDLPFDYPTVERFAGSAPMQPAGAAVLRLAWRHGARLGIVL